MNRWVKFQEIKAAAGIEAVLAHYEWKSLRRRGDRVEGRCPVHRGQRPDAFHVDLRRSVFHCFSCQAHGSVLDLAAAMERCSIRQAALWLEERFGGKRLSPELERGLRPDGKQKLVREKERIAAPLSFTLRPVDSAHPYLKQRGIEADTASHFGVGYYAGPGLMHGRVAIPIHDERGRMPAYAGRPLDGAHPKHKMPAGFRKSGVPFNPHPAAACGEDRVVVVEGFFDCMKVHQAGRRGVVALMGCSLSGDRERLSTQRFSNIVLMLDADAAGLPASRIIADRLIKHGAVEVVHLSGGRQPDRLSREEIHRALSAAARRERAGSKV